MYFMWNIVSHGIWLWIFCSLCLMFSTCLHMIFLLCENNVQACVFHVEFSVTRDMTVDFCCIYVQTFPQASTCSSYCVKILCKYVYFMWNIVSHGIWLWIFCSLCLMFSTCLHMIFLLCENNVQAYVFHVEFSVTRDMTVDFCCIYVQTFRHASKRNSCCVKIICKYVHFM